MELAELLSERLLDALRWMAFLEYIPKRGEYVRGFSYDELIDMLNIRADLEVRAVSWSIERITDDEMEQFDDIFRYMEFLYKEE